MGDEIDLHVKTENEERVKAKLTVLPTELRAVLRGSTTLGTTAMLAQEEATVPRFTGREQALTRSEVRFGGEDFTMGQVFTEAKYARYPEAGTRYQQAQRTFREALQMEIAPFEGSIDLGVAAALKL